MIRILLLGRTGNNIFQYALGRVLAEKHGVPLVLDASWFNAEGWAEVSHFLRLPHKARVIRNVTLASRALRRLTGKHYWEYRGVPVLRESTSNQSFDARFLDAPADCMMFGYFQSPLYFESRATELRSELTQLLSGAVQPLASLLGQLARPESVAVHVRRGDYLQIKEFQVCDMVYYQKSMRQMRARLPDARFFIFSDDPEWCRTEFTGADQTVIDSGDAAANPLHDLHLMSTASHHIIANSSYSWWAAWLGEKLGQQVIMPDRWYAHGIKAPMEEKRWKR
jgi:hypothetical protein